MKNAAQPADFASASFLVIWVIFPLFALLGGVVHLHDYDPQLLVSCVSLALAGLVFPPVLMRRPFEPLWPLGLLLLFIVPTWVASGRLSGAGWKGGISFLLVAIWLAIAWLISRVPGPSRAVALRLLPLIFLALTGLPPFLAFLSRNFGGEDWPRLAGASPLVTLFRLESGSGWEIGVGVSLGVLLLSWLRWRSKELASA